MAAGTQRLLYSQTYWGDAQKCTGLDQLLLARGPGRRSLFSSAALR